MSSAAAPTASAAAAPVKGVSTGATAAPDATATNMSTNASTVPSSFADLITLLQQDVAPTGTATPTAQAASTAAATPASAAAQTTTQTTTQATTQATNLTGAQTTAQANASLAAQLSSAITADSAPAPQTLVPALVSATATLPGQARALSPADQVADAQAAAQAQVAQVKAAAAGSINMMPAAGDVAAALPVVAVAAKAIQAATDDKASGDADSQNDTQKTSSAAATDSDPNAIALLASLINVQTPLLQAPVAATKTGSATPSASAIPARSAPSAPLRPQLPTDAAGAALGTGTGRAFSDALAQAGGAPSQAQAGDAQPAATAAAANPSAAGTDTAQGNAASASPANGSVADGAAADAFAANVAATTAGVANAAATAKAADAVHALKRDLSTQTAAIDAATGRSSDFSLQTASAAPATYDASGSLGAQAAGAATTPSTQTPASTLSDTATQTLQALSMQISKRVTDGSTKFNLELHPADLGRVDVALTIDRDGKVNAHLNFDTPVTAASFSAHESELRQSLSQAGLNLDGGNLTFSSRQDGDSSSSSGANSFAGQDPSQSQSQNSSQNQSQAHSQAAAQQAARAMAAAGAANDDADLMPSLSALSSRSSTLALNLIV